MARSVRTPQPLKHTAWFQNTLRAEIRARVSVALLVVIDVLVAEREAPATNLELLRQSMLHHSIATLAREAAACAVALKDRKHAGARSDRRFVARWRHQDLAQSSITIRCTVDGRAGALEVGIAIAEIIVLVVRRRGIGCWCPSHRRDGHRAENAGA